MKSHGQAGCRDRLPSSGRIKKWGISLADLRARRQLLYAFHLPSTYAHTHAVHVPIHTARMCIYCVYIPCVWARTQRVHMEICWASDCFPWKHNTINKRNIFPKGKAQQEQQHLALTAVDIPTPIYNWPEEATRSQTTGLCNNA